MYPVNNASHPSWWDVYS